MVTRHRIKNGPLYPSYVETQTAEEAYEDVLANVGCSAPMLDDHDKRVIQEVRGGTAAYSGGAIRFPGTSRSRRHGR
jgi:hypothetical protein